MIDRAAPRGAADAMPILSSAVALGLAATLGGGPCFLPPLLPGGPPFRPGELLTYDMELLLVKAGRFSLQVDRPLTHGAVLPLKARAQATAFAAVKRLAAVGIAWVDAKTLRPERYHEEGDEDGKRRSLDVRFPPGGAPYLFEEMTRGQRGTKTFERTGDPLDVVSAVYFLRAAKVSPGESFCLDVVGAGRLWRTVAVVAPGREKVETPAGRFETFRVDVEATRADLPPGAKGRIRKLHVWLTADARRLPVSMVGEVTAGPASATLVGWRGGD
jgi:hypothetical protein